LTLADRPWVVLGLSNQTLGGTPLPLPIPAPLSLGNCLVYVSGEFAMPMPYDLPSGPSRFVPTYSMSVPPASGLLGLSFYAQFVVEHIDTLSCLFCPEFFGTSNYATLVVGI
jgi:hypothetical protein